MRKHRGTRWIATMVDTVACLALTVALTARFGPEIPSILLISLALPALTLLSLFGAAIAAALCGPGRGWWRVAAGLAGLGLLADALFSMRPLTVPVPKEDRHAIRIVEFNAWTLNHVPLAATRWIESQQPDIVVLLEASGNSAVIATRLAASFPYRVSCRSERICSTLILSHWPFIAARGLAHGDADNRRALSAALARVATPFGPVPVVAIHLSRPLTARRQMQEIGLLIGSMRGTSEPRLIVAGDFNLPPWSRGMRTIRDSLGLHSTGGERPSWPAPSAASRSPTIWPIDHVLLGPAWTATRVTRGPDMGSDHYPFLVELSPSVSHANR